MTQSSHQFELQSSLRMRNAIGLALVCMMLGGLPQWASAQSGSSDPYRINEKPEAAQGIGVDEKTGDSVPMDVMFKDAAAQPIELGALFTSGQPVILSFNYSNCPKLCSVQLENMTRALKESHPEYKVGEDVQVISISMDPNEQSSRSKENIEKYVDLYGDPDSKDGWHFLTGRRVNIQAVAKACGFRYRYIARQKLYSHPPVFIMLSPEGKIVQYVYGLKYEPDVMKAAIASATDGTVSSAINPDSYFGFGCFVFDESTGKYTFQAMAAMRLGGIATVIILLVTLIPYWLFKSKVADEPQEFVIGKAQETTT